MSTIAENIDSLTPEERLAPPKYDGLWVLMVLLTTLIVGAITGIMVILLAYFAIGKFSLESGASPVLLVFITFLSLTVGNMLYYVIVSYIFPHIYFRGRTALSQITSMSIVLYVLFIPIYLIISGISSETSTILIAFSAHVVVNNFALTIILGLISQYRYSLLIFYASLISLIITSSVVVAIESQVSNSSSSKALFLLLGLTILTYTLSGTLTALISWIYYRIYQASGYDPIGAVYARIELDEREIERLATAELVDFHTQK